jgi:predicted RNA-binding protein with PUA-like domain
MTTWLLKTEPGDYSYGDLERDKRTRWTGVSNPAAQKAMRGMRKGDEAFIYHTGNERRIAGLARVVKGAYPDPDHPGETAAGDPKRVLVDVAPSKAAAGGATLAAIKADGRFEGFALVRQPRLSVMEVPEGFVGALKEMAGVS